MVATPDTRRRLSVSFFESAFAREPDTQEVSVEAFLGRCERFPVRRDVVRKAARVRERLRVIGEAALDEDLVEPWMRKWRRFETLRSVAQSSPAEVRRERVEARLADMVARAGPKARLPAFVPGRFVEGGRRRAEDVEALSMLVLDVDDGASPEEVAAAFEGHPRVAYTTWSWGGGGEVWKFRLVVPLAADVPATRWARVWRWARDRVGGTLDEVCKDASRMYFLPAVGSERQPRWSKRWDAEGPLLEVDVDALPMAPEEAPPAPRRLPPSTVGLPADVRLKALVRRLREHPGARQAFARELGAELTGSGPGERAIHIVCPACGRPSVFFFIEPIRQTGAACNHVNSCGWRGPLTDFLDLG